MIRPLRTRPMLRLLVFAVLACGTWLTMTAPTWAAPKVVTSIRPVQALVYAVMDEIGVPEVLLQPGISPHSFSLKPSQAEMLQEADIVFWVGPALESSLEGPLKQLSADARVVSLLEAPGLDLLRYEVDGAHGHDAHDEPDDHDGHGHGTVDPHVWLSPKNAQVLVDFIAQELTRLVPGNADIYAQNAKVAKNRIKVLARQMEKLIAPVKDVPYMVQHDGYGYLARDFGLTQVGQLQTLPGREPGARHVSEVAKAIRDKGVVCLFHEPQFTPALAQRLKAETGVRLAELDPMGGGLELSPTLSVRIVQQVVLAMGTCLYTLKEGEGAAPASAQ